jgi:hypothetical protein
MSEKLNEKLFMDMMAKADPGLWRVKSSLVRNGINPEVLPPVIEAIAHVYNTTKYGTIEIIMENGVITVTKGHSFRKVDVEVV